MKELAKCTTSTDTPDVIAKSIGKLAIENGISNHTLIEILFAKSVNVNVFRRWLRDRPVPSHAADTFAKTGSAILKNWCQLIGDLKEVDSNIRRSRSVSSKRGPNRQASNQPGEFYLAIAMNILH